MRDVFILWSKVFANPLITKRIDSDDEEPVIPRSLDTSFAFRLGEFEA